MLAVNFTQIRFEEKKNLFFLFEDIGIDGHMGSPFMNSGTHLIKSKCNCKIKGVGEALGHQILLKRPLLSKKTRN